MPKSVFALIRPISYVVQDIRRYMNDEHKNKKERDFDFTGWTDYTPGLSPFLSSPCSTHFQATLSPNKITRMTAEYLLVASRNVYLVMLTSMLLRPICPSVAS